MESWETELEKEKEPVVRLTGSAPKLWTGFWFYHILYVWPEASYTASLYAIFHLESKDNTFSTSQDSCEVRFIYSNKKHKQDGRNHRSCSLQASGKGVRHPNTLSWTATGSQALGWDWFSVPCCVHGELGMPDAGTPHAAFFWRQIRHNHVWYLSRRK